MKDLEAKLHQQFPESRDKCIEVIATELDVFDGMNYRDRKRSLEDEGYLDPDLVAIDMCTINVKTPKGYLAVTTTDNTLYLVKV